MLIFWCVGVLYHIESEFIFYAESFMVMITVITALINHHSMENRTKTVEVATELEYNSAEWEKVREKEDFFVLWTHQIKTPIAALKLLFEDETPNIGNCKSELFKIENYVEMALNYLRFEEMSGVPTSSAAIWASIVLAMSDANGNIPYALLVAGGAAVAGCSAHMIGFAVSSFRENRVGGLISQGLGTSMLQIPNIMKKPIIMIPEIIASAIVGPIAVAFGLLCDGSGGGMGTSGLVGVINTISVSMDNNVEGWKIGVGVALCLFIIPAIVCFTISEFMRKKNWIEYGDLKLDE